MKVQTRVSDSCLWLKHATALVPLLGKRFVAHIDGEPIAFEPMNQGKNQRPTAGWKPDAESKTAWARVLGRTVTLQVGALDVEVTPAPGAEVRSPLPKLSSTLAPRASPRPSLRRAETSGATVLGIDVAGKKKGFDLCLLTLGNTHITVRLSKLYPSTGLPSEAELRPALVNGDLAAVAELTFEAARTLARQLATFLPPNLMAISIDSPSSFARNQCGHGRRVEHIRLPDVNPQVTPSVSCGIPHKGSWGWLVYGMCAFAGALHGPELTGAQWRTALAEGLQPRFPEAPGFALLECFPTATLGHLRFTSGGNRLLQRLGKPADRTAAGLIDELRQAIQNGIAAVKKASAAPDQLDAFIAAITALPAVDPGFGWSEPGGPVGRWKGTSEDGRREGAYQLLVASSDERPVRPK